MAWGVVRCYDMMDENEDGDDFFDGEDGNEDEWEYGG